MKGALTFLDFNASQFILSNHGCFLISSVPLWPNLFLKSLCRSFFSKSWSLGENLFYTEKYFRDVNVFIDDRFEELHSIFIMVRWETGHHFVNKTPKTPPIDIDSMSSFFYDFRSQVLGSSTNWHCDTVFAVKNLWKSKISQLNVSLMIYDDVLRL